MMNTLEDQTQTNLCPVDRHFNIPTHNTPTVASSYILKVIYYIEKCKTPKMYKSIIIKDGFTCTNLQYSLLKLRCGKYGNRTEQLYKQYKL